MRPGRRRISEDLKQSRKKWADLFVRITTSRRQIPAGDIARYASEALAASPGVEQRLTETQVHFFRKRGSPRVPQTEEVANALVWALEDCGAWDGIAERTAQDEKLQLLNLLGFKALPRPAEVSPPRPSDRSGLDGLVGGQALRGKEGVLHLLKEVIGVARRGEVKKRYVLLIESSTGFHTASDPDIDRDIVSCLQQNVEVVYVIGQDWADYPAEDVLTGLSLLLKRAITQNATAESMATLKRRLFTILLPPPALPCWSTRLVRTAMFFRISGNNDASLSAKLLAEWGEPIGGWIEVLPDFHSRDSNLNLWTVLKNIGSACGLVARVWTEINSNKEVKVQPLFKESADAEHAWLSPRS